MLRVFRSGYDHLFPCSFLWVNHDCLDRAFLYAFALIFDFILSILVLGAIITLILSIALLPLYMRSL